MKKLNELKAKKNDLIVRMEALTSGETISEDAKREWANLDAEVKKIDLDIQITERQEELNKQKVEKKAVEETEKKKSTVENFRDWLIDSHRQNKTSSFFYEPVEERADPILTTTQSGIINKTVANSVDILTSPAEAFLRTLGVSIFPGLVGNFVIPAMAEDTAAFYAEDASAASANMAHEALTLTARRVSHTHMISRETLAQTNPAIYTSILQNLVNGVWNAVTNDVFDTLETDAATQVGDFEGGPISYTDIVNMEASIGGLNIGAGAYVTTPTVKAFLKRTAVLGSDNGPIWQGDTVNGYPAFGVPAANTDKVYFGDFSKCAVGQWGPLEIVVDPYSDAKKGLIRLTVIGLYDTGCYNKRAFAIMADASVV